MASEMVEAQLQIGSAQQELEDCSTKVKQPCMLTVPQAKPAVRCCSMCGSAIA